jgi:hypothetical protein
MATQPARQPPPVRAPRPRPRARGRPGADRGAAPEPARDHATRLERRRRTRRLQQLRRDLLVDLVAALALTIFVLIVTAGLGVVALLEIPVAGLVIGSFLVERRRRGRSGS